MTPEQTIGAAIGALVVIGGGSVALGTLLKRFGIGKCPEECPDPMCKSFVKATKEHSATAESNAKAAADAVIKAEKSIIKLQEGQNHVSEILEQKRIKIEGLQQDTTEIKTDVKWIVREIQKNVLGNRR
jgi:hypothetical protein